MVGQRNRDRPKIRRPSAQVLREFHARLLNEGFQKWLESKGAARGGRQRIERLIESCVRLVQLAPQANFDLLVDESADKGGRAYLENLAVVKECERLTDTVNRSLRRYKATPEIDVDKRISILWMPDSPEGSDAHAEFGIVSHIMDLIMNGELAKLRKCECGRYFLARSSIVRFCSEKCRIAYWENSETRKEQKRKKAKEYYRLHKTKNIK